MLVAPQFLVVLAILGAAFGIAALPILRYPRDERRPSLGVLVPHPSQPGSMLSFAFLSSFLILLSLARFGVFMWVSPFDSVNSPDSSRRLFRTPRGVHVDVVDAGPGEGHRFVYPRDTPDLIISAAWRLESGERESRVSAVRDLAWWAAVCPNYEHFTLPRLTRALDDPDPGVKGAAAIGLGLTGGNGAPAVPALLASRGTTVHYYDHLVTEAVLLIEHTPRWPPASECMAVSDQELERRAAQQGHEADRTR